MVFVRFSVKEYITTFNRPELLDRLVLKEESFDLEKDIGKRKEVFLLMSNNINYHESDSVCALFESIDYISRACAHVRSSAWHQIRKISSRNVSSKSRKLS